MRAAKFNPSCSKNKVYNNCCKGCGYSFSSADELKKAVEDFRSNTSNANKEYGVMNCWDVSSITEMSHIFDREEAENNEDTFNEPIRCWNVSRVTTMFSTFLRATSF